MPVELARGVGDILHVYDETQGDTLCGSPCTRPLVKATDDDLLCSLCLKAMRGDDSIDFGPDGFLQLDQFLADRLAKLPYELYLRTSHWQKMRALALDHYGRACVLCNGSPVDVHHRTYERRGRERLDDLIVLCSPCHSRYHQPQAA